MNHHYTLNEQQFRQIFPFYVRFNKNLRILAAGPSIEKMLGALSGSSLSDIFSFVHPKISITMHFDSLVQHKNTIIILDAKHYPIQTRFRGQFFHLEAEEELIYLNSPWFSSTLDLSLHNLTVSDFALHDPIMDHLQLIQSKQLINEEMQLLTAELIQQRDELLTKNETIVELAQFQEQNPQPILRLSFEGTLLYGNDCAMDLIEQHQLLELPLWRQLETTFSKNGYALFNQEIQLNHFVFLATFVPFKDKSYFNVYLREITETIRYQNELLTTSSRLHTLLDNMQSAVLAEDLERRIILVNQKFCDLFHIPFAPESMKGVDCSNAAQQSKHLFQNETAFIQRIDEILFERQSVFGDLLYLKNGKILERDYIPIFEDGIYSGHIWKYQDITEIIQQKENSIKVEEKYQRIIEDLNFGLVEVDLDEKATKVYPAFCELTGYSAEEILGKNVRNLILHEDDLTIIQRQNENRKKGQSGVYEIRIRTKNGAIKWLIISGTPIYNSKNEIVGSLGIHLDITDRKNMEDQLLLANEKAQSSMRAKELFLANMSHEIRTPLNVIIGMSELMDHTELNTEQELHLKAIKHSSENLLTLINDILDYSKMEAGHLDLEEVSFDVCQLIDAIRIGFSQKAKDKGIALHTEIDPLIHCKLLGDSHKLNQVLVNLISNALKFTEQGSVSMRISVQEQTMQNQRLLFEIIDTGIGISEENQEAIFDIFRQEDASISRKFGGTGLGLSISQNIIEYLGGKIQVCSKRHGGSTFSFSLTFEKDLQAVKAAPSPNRPDISTLRKIKVLIAEDNQMNQILITSILNKEHIAYDLANDGIEAIRLLEKQKYDLILLDIQMPKMDGVTTSKYIREKMQQTIPIIALTANASENDEKTYKAAGMNDYISKPYKREKLFESMVRLLDKEQISFPAAQSAYSLKNIEQIADGDQKFIYSIIETFRKSTPERLDEIATNIRKSNFEQVQFAVHQLKSSTDILEIKAIQQTVRELEIAAKEATPNIAQIERYFQQLTTTLTEVIHDLNSKF